MIVDDFLASLATLPGSQTCESYLSFVATGGAAAFRRDGGSEHVTASCFVFSPDFDRHDLQGGFSCNAHWDVGFGAIAATEAEVTVSEESEDVRWFRCTALPAAVPCGLRERRDNILDVIPTVIQ